MRHRHHPRTLDEIRLLDRLDNYLLNSFDMDANSNNFIAPLSPLPDWHYEQPIIDLTQDSD